MATKSVRKESDMDKKNNRTYTLTTEGGTRITVSRDVFLEELDKACQARPAIGTTDRRIHQDVAGN